MSLASKHRGVLLFALCLFSGWLSLPVKAQPKPVALTVDEVKNVIGQWRGSDHDLDREAIRLLARVRKNADVKVFFGTWCKDSQREVPRFLKVLSDLGEAPFSVEFFEVDENKEQPAKLLAANDILFVPTFVVTRQGREVGRIVERSPRALETDLALLLGGKTAGLVSASEPVIWHYLSSTNQ